MSNINEFKKIFSAIGILGFSGAGIASLFTAGIAPLAWGSAAFFLAGASGVNFLATDKIDLLEEQNQEIEAQLAELRLKCDRVTADRDDYKQRLELEVTAFKIRCKELQDGIEYWSDGKHPAIMELPPVKKLLELLKAKLLSTSERLEATLAEIIAVRDENKILTKRVTELEETNDEIDSELASKLLELAQLKTNFDYKLRDELHKQLQPYCTQAVAVALEKKFIETDKLKQAIAMLQEDIGSYQSVMDSLEKSTLPDIEKTYQTEMSEADSKLMQLSGQNQLLQQKINQLELPRHFPGFTNASNIGNHIIDHFAAHGVIFDAHTASVIAGGYSLKFWYYRTADTTKISAEEFGKIRSQVGLHGLSHKELEFKIDFLNLIVEVEVFTNPDDVRPGHGSNRNRTSDNSSLSTSGGLLTTKLDGVGKRANKSGQAIQGSQVRIEQPDIHRQKFVDLGCFPSDQFLEVLKTLCVPRIRICAGSEGGKSPLEELFGLAIGKLYNADVWLVNCLPGSVKDWFKIPNTIKPAKKKDIESGHAIPVMEQVAEVLNLVHQEFLERYNDLPSVKDKPFLLLILDEENVVARDYEGLGALKKDFYQRASHNKCGIITGGQGKNVSATSGGVSKKGTGNANKLMEEDFQNTTQVFTNQMAKAYIKKDLEVNKQETMQRLMELNSLCEELNKLEGRIATPKMGDEQKVSPDAYRIAMIISPKADEPIFIQIPPYSSMDLEGMNFPEGSMVTSPHWLKLAAKKITDTDNVLNAFDACPKCLSTDLLPIKPYADSTPRFECRSCRKTFGK